MATDYAAASSSGVDALRNEADDGVIGKRNLPTSQFDELPSEDDPDAPLRFDFCDLCSGLTEQIPAKCFNLDKGFVNERVVPTCLDADGAQIAVGTSVGSIYIFNRRLRKMFTVKGRDKIECLRLSHNGEYSLIGVGLETGLFVALQLPSSGDGKSRKLLEKAVADVHRCRIACIEWSADGRKLFTGDASGLIMMTLVDFENDVFDSSFVYCDADHCGITQLAYWGDSLAASTAAQALLVDIADDCRVRFVRRRNRKSSSTKCGVAFVRDGSRAADIRPRLYVSRPAYRLWRVDMVEKAEVAAESGEADVVLEVVETQDYLRSTSATASLPIPLDLQQSDHPPLPTSSAGFGLLYHMAVHEKGQPLNLLVTHDDRQLFLIDSEQRMLLGWARFRFRVTDVAVCASTREIFVLFLDPESSPLILRISPTFADPWLVASSGEEKRRKKSSSEDGVSVAGTSVKEFFQKLKSGSSELVSKSADAFSIKELDSSAPNFQLFLNKIRATSAEAGDGGSVLAAAAFEDAMYTNAVGAPASGSSTPDTVSLASAGGGTSLPPWCLDDQSLHENSPPAVSYRVRVTKSKGRNGSRSRLAEKKADGSTAAAESGSKSSSSDGAVVASKEIASLSADDLLTTPTEEKYLLNRFNPFDDAPARRSTAATREQLEELLDSTFLCQASMPQGDDDVESIVECVARDKTDSMNWAGEEASLHSLDSSDPKKRNSSGSFDSPDLKKQPAAIATSFRQLLLNEARVALAEESEPARPIARRTATAELLASPDDGEVSSFGLSGVSGRDIWCQVNHDRPIVYLAGCEHYFAFVDVEQVCRYFSYARNDAVDGDLLSTTDRVEAWSTLHEKADAFAVSPNGRIVWRVLDEVAYGQLKPNVHAPVGRKWCEAGKEVSTKIAVSNSSAWYLKTDGSVCAQTQLRPDRPCFKISHIDCEWPLVQLACTDDVVWGLRHDGRLVVRIGIKLPESPTGADWIDFVPDGPSEVVALDLRNETAWVIDTEGKLWFCKGVNSRHPIGTTGRWWQVALPAPLASNGSASSRRRTLPHAVCVTPVAVHMAVDRSIWYCRGGVTGHRWSRVIPMEWESVGQFRRLWASCLFDETSDYVWLVRLNNEFMAFQPHSKRLQSLAAAFVDSEVVAICGASGYLWTLDDSGRVFIRSGIDSINCPLGSRWQMLDATQFEGGPDDSVKFAHISCSLDAVWACDQSGRVYVRLGVAPLESTGLPSVWLLLDNSDEDGERKDEDESRSRRRGGVKRREVAVRKLFCTPDGAAVWALSRGGRIYVRLGITRDVPIGRRWSEIEDMRARTLAVGCDCAWALSEDFELHQRYGISRENPAGNFWKPLSQKLRSVAASPDGKLWGLDMEQRLVKHQTRFYASAPKGAAKSSGETSADSSAELATGNEYSAELHDFEVV